MSREPSGAASSAAPAAAASSSAPAVAPSSLAAAEQFRSDEVPDHGVKRVRSSARAWGFSKNGVTNFESKSHLSLCTAARHIMWSFFAIHRVVNVVIASNAMIDE